MFIDKQAYLSENQEITVSAESNRTFDFNERSNSILFENRYESIQLALLVTSDFLGGDSLAISLQTDDNSSFTSATTLCTTEAVSIEYLHAGRGFQFNYLPVGLERYIRLYYTVVGTMVSGVINAFMVLDNQMLPAGNYQWLALTNELGIFITTEDDEYILPF